jgi:hypothetical protein
LRRFLGVVLPVLVVVLTCAVAAPSSANTIATSDGNDTRGPLDLSGFQISHSGSTQVFKFSTFSRFTNRDVGKNGNFAVGIDVNGDQKYDYWVYVLYASGKMRGVLTNRSGDVITYELRASRQRRSATVELPLSKVKNPKSYDAAGFSVFTASPCSSKRPCVDGVPNRFPLIRHDLTGPKTIWVSAPAISTDVSATTTYPIQFTVKDDRYGSGVESWEVQSSYRYCSACVWSEWSMVATGTDHSPTVQVPGLEGATIRVRVIATDNQGNVGTSSVRETTIPFDDRSDKISYSPAASQLGPPGAYQGTTSSVANTGTATFTSGALWSKLCVVGGPTATASSTSTATISINGGAPDSMTAESDATSPLASVYCATNPIPNSPGLTVVITGTSSEAYVIDGIVQVS